MWFCRMVSCQEWDLRGVGAGVVRVVFTTPIFFARNKIKKLLEVKHSVLTFNFIFDLSREVIFIYHKAIRLRGVHNPNLQHLPTPLDLATRKLCSMYSICGFCVNAEYRV